jgi:hypothetical protein
MAPPNKKSEAAAPKVTAEDDPNTIICPARGVRDIGEIDAATAKALKVKAGPIRLLLGYEGRTGGWGLKHLETRNDRVKAIKALGYATCEAFVFEIAAQWVEVHPAAEPERLKLVWPTGGLDLAIVVEWSETFWSVTTALPFRPTNKPKLYVKAAV